MTQTAVTIQIMPQSAPSLPSWRGEAAAFAQVLTHTGNPQCDPETGAFRPRPLRHLRPDRFRCGADRLCCIRRSNLESVLRTARSLASPFMALFGRNRLPHRSTLSRFLAALAPLTVEALRTLFQEDLLARKLFSSSGSLVDRTGEQWLVVDVDGTRQAAR